MGGTRSCRHVRVGSLELAGVGLSRQSEQTGKVRGDYWKPSRLEIGRWFAWKLG